GNIVLDSWMALLQATGSRSPPTGRAQRHLVVEHDVVANLGSLSNHDTSAVVNEKAFSNLCSGVNLYATCNEAGKLRDQAWQKWDMSHVKSMSEAMVDDCPKTLVDHCLKNIAAGRVFLEDYIDYIWPASSSARCFARGRYKYPWWKLW